MLIATKSWKLWRVIIAQVGKGRETENNPADIFFLTKSLFVSKLNSILGNKTKFKNKSNSFFKTRGNTFINANNGEI